MPFFRPSKLDQVLANQRASLASEAAILLAVKNLQSAVNVVINVQETKLVPGITDIQSAQAAEKADLVTLTGLISQLLAAFASGAMTPAQAQAVLDEINSEDATVKTNISTIQAALPAPPAATPAS